METFRYRKLPDFRLSLALLLHDTGKPIAASAEGRRFDRHAELGANTAERFMRRLGFPSRLIGEVSYLVRYHMLPAALPRLPLNRSQDAVENPLFPVLLELYKCDELSTFRGPEGYYEACAAYRGYLRNCRNPLPQRRGEDPRANVSRAGPPLRGRIGIRGLIPRRSGRPASRLAARSRPLGRGNSRVRRSFGRRLRRSTARRRAPPA